VQEEWMPPNRWEFLQTKVKSRSTKEFDGGARLQSEKSGILTRQLQVLFR
jgi:hypothetical protein